MSFILDSKPYNLRRYSSFIIVTCWVIFVLWVSYKCRFWINNDTIGSLDSARDIRNYHFIGAINGYFGIGYATFLSLFNLNNLSSWFNIHLLIGFLIIGAQICIYKSLVYLEIRKFLALFLCLIWGASNYATGGALFLTADVPLCFLASLYLWLSCRTFKDQKSTNLFNAGWLGTLHALAALTKMVALFGLLLFPVALCLREFFGSEEQRRSVSLAVRRSGKFLAAYFLPLIIILGIFGWGAQVKFGQFTLGTTGAYNFNRYVNHSEKVIQAFSESKYHLPGWGTYWWSDISPIMINIGNRFVFDINTLAYRVIINIRTFLTSKEGIFGAIAILSVLMGTWGCIITISQRKGSWIVIPLFITSLTILFLYTFSQILARYLTFSSIFALPAVAVLIQHYYDKGSFIIRKAIMIILIFALLHGIGAMAYASIKLAPDSTDFDIAHYIKGSFKNKDEYSPMGAYSYKLVHYHYGYISFLLKAKTAEINKTSSDKYDFSATFQPKTVLLVLQAGKPAPPAITVNKAEFALMKSWYWAHGKDAIDLILYKAILSD